MRRRYILTTGMATVLALQAGCALVDLVAPEDPDRSEIRDGQVRVKLHITPTILGRPDEAMAVLTYENLGSEPVTIRSGDSCLSRTSVYRGKARIPFPSTEYGCFAVLTDWELEPGTPLTVQWRLEVGGEGGMDVPTGRYHVVADLGTHPGKLVRTFRVR